MTCDHCTFETDSYLDLVKHLRFAHGFSIHDACNAANRRQPTKTLAEAVRDHDRCYGIEPA